MVSRMIKNALDFLGFRTTRKLIIFCSDDWGGIRVESNSQRQRLMSAGLDVDGNRFDKFDTLESNEDIQLLFNVLTKHKDSQGNHPVFTAVMSVANPDFERIRQSEFREYHFEPFTDSLAKRRASDKVYQLYKEGIRARIFSPQFHGREHLQINLWMHALQIRDRKTLAAFDEEYYLPGRKDVGIETGSDFAEAFNFSHKSELIDHERTVISGVDIFRKSFGCAPSYFAAPVLIFNSQLITTLKHCGIALVDVPKLRLEPVGAGRYRRKVHFTGQSLARGVYAITRNAVFESNLEGYGVQQCLLAIEQAFHNKKPAVISNHRASFVGGVDKNNRTEGLRQLGELFTAILKRWPDVEFVDMDKMVSIIRDGKDS